MDNENITGLGNETGSHGDPDLTPYLLGLFIAFSSVILNGFLLLVLARERKSFLHMRVTYYIINLGVADLLTGALIFFLVMTRVFYINVSPFFETIMVILNWTTLQCSFYTLLMMSFDRLVLVLYSLSWSRILTIPRAVSSIVACWLVSIVGGICMYFYSVETRLAILVFVEVSILIFVCNTLFIYPVLKKREKARCVTTVSQTQSDVSIQIRRVSNPIRYDHMSRVVITLIVLLIVTQLPFIICMQLKLVHKLSGCRYAQIVLTDSFEKAFAYTQAFAGLNFAINPIIYGWRVKKYREAFSNTLC